MSFSCEWIKHPENGISFHGDMSSLVMKRHRNLKYMLLSQRSLSEKLYDIWFELHDSLERHKKIVSGLVAAKGLARQEGEMTRGGFLGHWSCSLWYCDSGCISADLSQNPWMPPYVSPNVNYNFGLRDWLMVIDAPPRCKMLIMR